MNEEFQTPMTEEQLRLATSRSLPAGAKLDAENASLREGLLALGSALETVAGDFDEAALLAKLRSSGTDSFEPRSEQRLASVNLPKPAAASSNLTWLVVGVVLAASALVAIVRLVAVSSGPEERTKVVAAPDVPVAPVQPDRATLDQYAPETASNLQVATTWVDPLDNEIASAQAEMQWLTSRGYGLDGSLSQIGQQLESLSQELVGGSL